MVRHRSIVSLICAATFVVALGALVFSSVPRALADNGLYAAQAAGKTRITVDGKAYTSAAHGEGESGIWDWDGQSNLTLTDFTGDSIMASGSLNVTVNGNVSMKYLGLEPMLEASEGHGVTATGEYLKGDVSITGGGKLALSDGKAYFQLEELDVDYVEDPDSPHHSGASGQTEVMHWDSCSINATNVAIENSDWGLSAYDVAITNGSTVVVKGPGLGASGKLSIMDSSVENDLEQYMAFGDGDVLIERSTVTVKGRSAPGRWEFALNAESVDVRDSVVSIIGGASGLYSSGSLRVQNSDVTIQGQKTHDGQPFAALVGGEITLEDVGGASVVEGDNCKLLESEGSPEGTVILKALGKRVLGDVSNGSIALLESSYTYDGKAKTPDVTVKIGSQTLMGGADYTVSYKNNVNAGIAIVTVTGVSSAGYTGAKSATFQIKARAVTPTVSLSKASLTYSGKAQKPGVTVKAGSVALPASAYSVAYPSDCKSVGAHKVAVTLKGNYSGAGSATFSINPKGTKLSKVTAAKKGFTAKWGKQATQTTGYQLQYALNKKFTSAKTVTVKGAKAVSKKVTKLKAKKKYWVRVRTYKAIGRAIYCSSWSASKTVKAK